MNSRPNTKQGRGIIDSVQLFEWTAKNLPVRFFGEDVLHRQCEPIADNEFNTASLREIADALIDTLSKYREHTSMGRGIAANQIGYSRQLIVVLLDDQPVVLINPKLTASEGLGSYWESCISSGTLLIGKIHRPWSGMFEYQDISGEHHTMKANEIETRILLHEMDHLEGIICPEKYEPQSLRFIRDGKDEILGYPLTRIK